MNNIFSDFFRNYKDRKGFWYSFKRSVNDIENLYTLLRHLQNFENQNWFKSQKKYSEILIKEKILVPSKSSQDASANSRGIKKVFELLGLCYVDRKENLRITEAGHKFLEIKNETELYNVKTVQLLKYQINNPLIKSSTYKEMKIKPYVFLLELLTKLDDQSIDMIEYKLFVCRAHHYDEIEKVFEQIKLWRGFTEDEKNIFIKKIDRLDVYKSVNNYASYSLSFFGKSEFTDISELEENKVLYLKKNKFLEICEILKRKDIHSYNSSLEDEQSFMEYYGKLEINNQSDLRVKEFYKHINNKEKSNIDKKNNNNEDQEKNILNQKINDLFFLTGRTSKILLEQKIIYLKDLLIWNTDELKKMQRMGNSSVTELENKLHDLNKRTKLNLKFYKKGEYFKNVDDDEIKTKKEINEYKPANDLYTHLSSWTKKFENLSGNDQINFFRTIEMTFDDVRINNLCKNLGIATIGDLHQTNQENLLSVSNAGRKSLDRINKKLQLLINTPVGTIVDDWEEIKKSKYKKFENKLKDRLVEDHKNKFKDLNFLEDEIELLMQLIKFKRKDIIYFHYGFDGSDLKTLQESGDHFGITRERVRQITSKFLRLVQIKNIKGFKILSKILEILQEIVPIRTTTFEKILLEKELVKKRYTTPALLSLMKTFLKSNEFLIYQNKQIIDKKNEPLYKKIIKNFGERNLNLYGILNVNFVAKKLKINPGQILDILKIRHDLSSINETWIYDNDKTRNRLYNLLQKIFNVNSTINKFQIYDALKRNKRLITPSMDTIVSYCKEELNANETSEGISVPKEQIFKNFYNSKREILSDIEKQIISCFKNDKILSYRQLVNKLIDQGVNVHTANLFTSGNTPVLIKVNPGCYSLVGTKLSPGEQDDFYKKNKGKGEKIVSDYDHNDDGSIWIGYEFNQKTKDKRNFKVQSSIKDILKGDYMYKDINQKIKINNHGYITGIAHKNFKKDIKIGEDIIFTFDTSKRRVNIEVGEDLMKEKYKPWTD
tara:strand:- start:7212 stop:10217 length:3006 start_codon:yes stop_codon:yes gene_type:complete